MLEIEGVAFPVAIEGFIFDYATTMHVGS